MGCTKVQLLVVSTPGGYSASEYERQCLLARSDPPYNVKRDWGKYELEGAKATNFPVPYSRQQLSMAAVGKYLGTTTAIDWRRCHCKRSNTVGLTWAVAN
jgi:hypothetical protein